MMEMEVELDVDDNRGRSGHAVSFGFKHDLIHIYIASESMPVGIGRSKIVLYLWVKPSTCMSKRLRLWDPRVIVGYTSVCLAGAYMYMYKGLYYPLYMGRVFSWSIHDIGRPSIASTEPITTSTCT